MKLPRRQFLHLAAGAVAPARTPAGIVDKLNREINAGLADPKIEARLANLGGDVLALSPADFGRLIADETEKWGNVIRALNIKADSVDPHQLSAMLKETAQTWADAHARVQCACRRDQVRE